MYANVCMRTHATVSLCTSFTWTLTPSLINVRGLRQALHAAFGCDGQILGPPVAPGVRVGTMHDASTKTALLLIKQMFCPHSICFVLSPFQGNAAFWVSGCERDHPSVLKQGVRRIEGWMLATIHLKDCGQKDVKQSFGILEWNKDLLKK